MNFLNKALEYFTVKLCKPEYSNFGYVATFFLIVICSFVVLVKTIPSGQAPDELAHMYRAVSLAHGNIFVKEGDNINEGLLEYYEKYSILPFHPERKAWQIKNTEDITFSDQYKFTTFVTSAVYFPLSYLPQSIAIYIGEKYNLKVKKVVFLSRLLNFVAILSILAMVVKVWKLPLLTCLILLMPISLFQMSTVASDGVHFALTALIIALFLRLEREYSNVKYNILLILIFTIVTHRMNMFFLLALPFWLAWKHEKHRPKLLVLGIILMSAVIAWLLFAIGLSARSGGKGMVEVALYYLFNPVETIEIFYRTLTNIPLLVFYRDSFVGILGWLDYSVSSSIIYITHFIILFGMAFLLFKCRNLFSLSHPVPFLLVLAVVGILSTFIFLLIQWTPFPCSGVIEGVQGRYFINVFIVISFAVSYIDNKISENSMLAHYIVVFYGIYSLYATYGATLQRYWQ